MHQDTISLVFQTAPAALRTLASEILSGQRALTVERRGGQLREYDAPVSVVLTNPRARLSALAGRQLDPWVSLAEFPWLIAGRNDVAWLEPYLPRAKDFSDDGLLWRAGYGPRMRSWTGLLRNTDQLAECVARLARNPMTRQAVVTLWDPESDNEEGSKDYPCSNWLHFQRNARTNALDLHVVMRSNDLWWGLSGVNLVNFTLLQELVAGCLGWPLGVYRHTADNLHLYERHWEAARSLNGPDLYDHARPSAMVVARAESAPLRKLEAFTSACSRALEFVTEARESEDPCEFQVSLGGRFGKTPWVQEWANFMALHRPRALGQLRSIEFEDWRAAAWAHASQKVAPDTAAALAVSFLGGPLNAWMKQMPHPEVTL